MTLEEAKRLPNIDIEDAHLMMGKFRNFSGRPSKYNREGDRNFCVRIEDEEMAQRLTDDNWKVKILAPREEGDRATNYLQVSVKWNPAFPRLNPKIFLVSGINGRKTEIDEETVDMLDDIEIEHVDLSIRPRPWTDDDGVVWIKAYLDTMYITDRPDRFASKYADSDTAMPGA